MAAWTQQALAYSMQTGCRPALALFGAADRDTALRIYLKLRDNRPPIELWLYFSWGWERVTSRAACRRMTAVVTP
jgi:hypothetical protein